MKNYTKNGLIFLMIGILIGIVSNLSLFFIDFDVNIDNLDDIYIILLPVLLLVAVSGIIMLVGAVLIIIGRKDYGEKHSKFVTYALITFLVSILLNFAFSAFSVFISFSTYSSIAMDSSSFDLTGLINLSAIQTIITASVSGLIYVFLLYHLENKNGKYVLLSYYTILVVLAISIGIYNHGFMKELFSNIETLSANSYSQILAQISNLSKVSIINSIGSILLLIAVYIPYKRIITRDLVPVLPSHLKRCMNCGRVGPSDSVICAYCRHEFNDSQYKIYR